MIKNQSKVKNVKTVSANIDEIWVFQIRVVQLQAHGPILARKVIFLARDKLQVICMFRSENIYLVIFL